MPTRQGHRRFGSIRVLRDGRVRFSEWSFPGLHSLSFTTEGHTVDAVRGTRQVLILWLDDDQRVSSACFPYDLSPEELHAGVATLRKAGHGLECWIVPALEYTQAALIPTQHRPDLLKVIPGLLASCRDLSVAEQWRRVRANVFANAEKAKVTRKAEEVQRKSPRGKGSVRKPKAK